VKNTEGEEIDVCTSISGLLWGIGTSMFTQVHVDITVI
jgi:hypothetical protein